MHAAWNNPVVRWLVLLRQAKSEGLIRNAQLCLYHLTGGRPFGFVCCKQLIQSDPSKTTVNYERARDDDALLLIFASKLGIISSKQH